MHFTGCISVMLVLLLWCRRHVRNALFFALLPQSSSVFFVVPPWRRRSDRLACLALNLHFTRATVLNVENICWHTIKRL